MKKKEEPHKTSWMSRLGAAGLKQKPKDIAYTAGLAQENPREALVVSETANMETLDTTDSVVMANTGTLIRFRSSRPKCCELFESVDTGVLFSY